MQKMKYLFIAASFLLIHAATAQESSKAILEVQGEASLSVKPTRTIVTLSVKATEGSYAETVEDLVNRIDALVKVLKGLKFKDQDIRTSNFRIDKNFVYIQGERREKGFNGTQILNVSFDQDKELLLKVLNKAAASQAEPEISVTFSMDEAGKSNLEKQLIQLAVQDATDKANLIAETSNYKVSGIKEISYGVQNVQPVFQTARTFEMMAESASPEISSFEASDLVFSDQVLIRFYIESK